MEREVKLTPGWLMRDVRRAAERLDHLSTSDQPRANSIAAQGVSDQGKSEKPVIKQRERN